MDFKLTSLSLFPSSIQKSTLILIVIDSKKIYNEIKREILESVNTTEVSTRTSLTLSAITLFEETYEALNNEATFCVSGDNEFILDFGGYKIKGHVSKKIEPYVLKSKSIYFTLTYFSYAGISELGILGIKNITQKKI